MSPDERFAAELRDELRTTRTDEDVVEHGVTVAVGAASACWSHLSGAGTFDDVRARIVVDVLLEFVRERGAR